MKCETETLLHGKYSSNDYGNIQGKNLMHDRLCYNAEECKLVINTFLQSVPASSFLWTRDRQTPGRGPVPVREEIVRAVTLWGQ